MANIEAAGVPNWAVAAAMALLCLVAASVPLASCTPDWSDPAMQGAMRVNLVR